VQHERVRVPAQLGDDERGSLRHEARDERDVAAQPIQLRDDDRRLDLARRRECCGQPRPTLERVGALAGLNLDELGDDVEALGRGKGRDRLALRLEPEARASLAGGADADVADDGGQGDLDGTRLPPSTCSKRMALMRQRRLFRRFFGRSLKRLALRNHLRKMPFEIVAAVLGRLRLHIG
jgi:hypothetical protein